MKNSIKNREERWFLTEKTYRCALYIRLSKENGGREDGGSAAGQEAMLRSFVAKTPGLEICSVYTDNGFGGTDFDRPAFNRMISDMKSGLFQCIIVKDLSRFGRNYLEAGYYLEKVFPLYQVRFISVNDQFDTGRTDMQESGLVVPLKNLVNDLYARDISGKVSSALKAQMKRGVHGGGAPPYGYRKSRTDRGSYEVDPEAARVVRLIYRLRAGGSSYASIVRELEAGKILCPAAYRAREGIYAGPAGGETVWNRWSVSRILHDPVYTGYMTRGKTRKAMYRGERRHRTPREEWILVPGRHEPIIERELYERVQEGSREHDG